MTNSSRLWWERDDIHYTPDGVLQFGGQTLIDFVQSSGTPTYIYNMDRLRSNIERLWYALDSKDIRFKIFFAIKANRHHAILTYMRTLGRSGIDACSPGELLLARQMGFKEEEICYTSTSVSNADIDCLAKHPNVWVNCDSLSSLRRLGQRCPGRAIGLRINPQVGAGYTEDMTYAGDKTTKFGLYPDQFEEALDIAKTYNMSVKTLHFHIGSGYLTPQIGKLDEALERSSWFLDQCPEVDTFDIGGGLGLPLVEGEAPMDVEAWSQIVAKHAKARDLTIYVEPGDYLVKDTAVLLLEVNTVEAKMDTTFIGVNGGFNIQNSYVYYDTPFIVAPLVKDPTAPTSTVTIAGNINESIDLLAKDIQLPPIAEGDYLALLNVGGYGAATSSNHCSRGTFSEYILWPEA
ncbi:MAG: diaminopimelate decarboxylase [Chloroflexota bacterium]